MIKIFYSSFFLVFLFLICPALSDDVPEDAAYATWDYKIHNVGQVEQVNLTYDLFVHFELDDYGTEYDEGDTYIGENEQKERIRKRFQEPTIKYFETFDDHYGWG